MGGAEVFKTCLILCVIALIRVPTFSFEMMSVVIIFIRSFGLILLVKVAKLLYKLGMAIRRIFGLHSDSLSESNKKIWINPWIRMSVCLSVRQVLGET